MRAAVDSRMIPGCGLSRSIPVSRALKWCGATPT